MWPDAIELYQAAANGVLADDTSVLFGLAQAQFAAGDARAAEATLDRLRAAHPTLKHQEAHLLYARALEAQGRMAEAEQEYAALSRYYAGLEARTRYGLLLLRRGEPEQARALFEDVVRAGNARRIAATATDGDWLKVAKANL